MPRRTTRLLLWTAPLLAATVVGVAMHMPQAQPAAAPAGAVTLTVTAVPLNPEDRTQTAIGRFTYQGGVELTTGGVRFGGLSDLDMHADGSLLSVTDEGQWVTARLVLDANGRLTGVENMHTQPLVGIDGAPLRDKQVADAEGVAILPDGDRLVSFEREHRIWRYPAGGGSPVAAPTPPTRALPPNSGLEGLGAAPALGAGAYLVGSETGIVWSCTLTTTCRETALGSFVPPDFSLTGIAVSPDGSVIALATRAFEASIGVRVRVRLLSREALDNKAAAPLDELVLEAPFTRDNVEGISLLAGRNGTLRLYLLSDNNFSETQHTYLLAFDWTPPAR